MNDLEMIMQKSFQGNMVSIGKFRVVSFQKFGLGITKMVNSNVLSRKSFRPKVGGAQAQPLISKLMNAFHPSLERVFDVDYSVHEDVYAVSRGLVIGERLDVAIVDVDNSTVLTGFGRQSRLCNIYTD